MEKHIVLFSGGIDSTAALYWALDLSQKTSALTFDYGQKHKNEIHAAVKIAGMLGVLHKILSVDLEQIGGSSLTDSSVPLPEAANVSHIHEGLPTTYVPFRNGIFLALAAAWAETKGITGCLRIQRDRLSQLSRYSRDVCESHGKGH